MHCAQGIVGGWCVGRSCVPLVGCVGGVGCGAQCILHKSSRKVFVIAIFFISVRLAITDDTISTVQSCIDSSDRCLCVGCIPTDIICGYCMVVYLVLLLYHLDWDSFHFRTLSMMIRLAVQTTQKEKKTSAVLK